MSPAPAMEMGTAGGRSACRAVVPRRSLRPRRCSVSTKMVKLTLSSVHPGVKLTMFAQYRMEAPNCRTRCTTPEPNAEELNAIREYDKEGFWTSRIAHLAMTSAQHASRITMDIQPPVARISLHHPPLNVIDVAMMDELAQALEEIEAGRVSKLLLSGAGKVVFGWSGRCRPHAGQSRRDAGQVSRRHSGAGQIEESDHRGRARPLSRRRRGTRDGLRPGVHRRHGAWAFPEIKLGCYPPVAATALAALVGQKHAADLILTGRSITGTEAASIGLANRASLIPRWRQR